MVGYSRGLSSERVGGMILVELLGHMPCTPEKCEVCFDVATERYRVHTYRKVGANELRTPFEFVYVCSDECASLTQFLFNLGFVPHWWGPNQKRSLLTYLGYGNHVA